MSSNWLAMQARLSVNGGPGKKLKVDVKTGGSKSKRPVPVLLPTVAAAPPPVLTVRSSSSSLSMPLPQLKLSLKPFCAGESSLTEVLALDCEMVGVGAAGTRSVLAQVVIVNSREELVYSAYVKPGEAITDFRTHVSGIRSHHLAHAIPFRQAQTEVAKLVYKRHVVGHGMHNDLKALQLSHPKTSLRDTALFSPLRTHTGVGSRARKLSELAREKLGLIIQTGEHSPLEDAIAALRLYKLHAAEWERTTRGFRHSPGVGKARRKAKAKAQARVRRDGVPVVATAQPALANEGACVGESGMGSILDGDGGRMIAASAGSVGGSHTTQLKGKGKRKRGIV